MTHAAEVTGWLVKLFRMAIVAGGMLLGARPRSRESCILLRRMAALASEPLFELEMLSVPEAAGSWRFGRIYPRRTSARG